MGNDVSLQNRIELEEKATEVTEYYALYSAELRNERSLSIFRGESCNETFWKRKNPLEKAGKNLMLFRHPKILKYESSWQKGTLINIVTEQCKPLHLLLKTQSPIHICLGLKSILQALIFLVEKCGMRHLNICLSSIYVSNEREWKLGGFEFLFKKEEITGELLELSKTHRYQKAIDVKNEVATTGQNLEQFAFSVVCQEIFKFCPQSNKIALDFQEFCANQLEKIHPSGRPTLSAILEHPYFNQDFMKIQEFLSEIPVKSSMEKQEFFTDLIKKIKAFDEVDVAIHLGDYLLSRVVLLDETARCLVTPFVLDPKSDELVPGIFTTPTFAKHIIPKLSQIFCVHDAQIRMILLEHFNKFMNLFPDHELRTIVLPQLLLGIKDTNDHLVSMTLRCLADLVPILGASVVIGKNRNRIFSDGRPQKVNTENMIRHWPEPRSITPVMEGNQLELCQQSFADLSHENLVMPERLAPDGGEDSVLTDNDDDQWSDWENDNREEQSSEVVVLNSLENGIQTQPEPTERVLKALSDDINDLDIKVHKSNAEADAELDFFKDMEPVITKAEPVLTSNAKDNEVGSSTSRLTIRNEVEDVTESGWDDNISDWE